MKIRVATDRDFEGVWEVFQLVTAPGDTYTFPPDSTREDLLKHWFATHMKAYVAVEDERVLGTFVIRPNQTGLGSHIANCGYMVHPESRGKGIGGLMCQFSLDAAKKQGYQAMQFNTVVSTNVVAVKLWERYGFKIIGTTPKGFKHLSLGYVDTHIMYREL